LVDQWLRYWQLAKELSNVVFLLNFDSKIILRVKLILE